MPKRTKVVLDYKVAGDLCLRSQGIISEMYKNANRIKGQYGQGAKIKFKRSMHGANRPYIYIESSMKEASRDNKMLKSVK